MIIYSVVVRILWIELLMKEMILIFFYLILLVVNLFFLIVYYWSLKFCRFKWYFSILGLVFYGKDEIEGEVFFDWDL